MADTLPNRRRWFRPKFGIRAILVLMVAVAAPLAWKMNQLTAQQRGIEAIRASAASRTKTIPDRSAPGEEAASITLHPAWGPDWLHGLMGKELFQDVRVVNLVEVHGSEKDGIPAIGPVADAEIAWIANFPRVDSVRVCSSGFTDSAMGQLARASSITALQLMGPIPQESDDDPSCPVTDQGIALLAKLPALERMTFIGRAELTNFAQLRSLKHLNAQFPRLGHEGLNPLFALEKLESATLYWKTGPIPPLDRLEETVREKLPHLVQLDLYTDGLSFEWNPSKSLSLFARSGLQHLPRIPQVSELKLGVGRLSDEDLRRIEQLPNLTYLGVRWTDSPEEILALFDWATSRLAKLERLELESRSQSQPDANFNWRRSSETVHFETSDLKQLPQTPLLKALELEVRQLSEEDLDRIAALPNLKKLTVVFSAPRVDLALVKEGILGRIKELEELELSLLNGKGRIVWGRGMP